MIKLYETGYCPYCGIVKKKLEELELEFTTIAVPSSHHLRMEVRELSGQSLVPIIVDGEKVINDSRKIIKYLNSKYSHNN